MLPDRTQPTGLLLSASTPTIGGRLKLWKARTGRVDTLENNRYDHRRVLDLPIRTDRCRWRGD